MVKPIEPGCWAILINSINNPNGMCLNVISEAPFDHYETTCGKKFNIPEGHKKIMGKIWEVDKELNVSDPRGKSYKTHCVSEYYLMRIDGGEKETEKREDRELELV